jgi:hypothetical protein
LFLLANLGLKLGLREEQKLVEERNERLRVNSPGGPPLMILAS